METQVLADSLIADYIADSDNFYDVWCLKVSHAVVSNPNFP
jgi:hypothetical protein